MKGHHIEPPTCLADVPNLHRAVREWADSDPRVFSLETTVLPARVDAARSLLLQVCFVKDGTEMKSSALIHPSWEGEPEAAKAVNECLADALDRSSTDDEVLRLSEAARRLQRELNERRKPL